MRSLMFGRRCVLVLHDSTIIYFDCLSTAARHAMLRVARRPPTPAAFAAASCLLSGRMVPCCSSVLLVLVRSPKDAFCAHRPISALERREPRGRGGALQVASPAPPVERVDDLHPLGIGEATHAVVLRERVACADEHRPAVEEEEAVEVLEPHEAENGLLLFLGRTNCAKRGGIML